MTYSYFLACAALICTQPLLAQSEAPVPVRALELGLGLSHSDYAGLRGQLGYRRYFASRFFTSMRLSFTRASQPLIMGPGAPALPRSYRAAYLEYALYYNFLTNTRRLAVAVGTGPCLGYVRKDGYAWVKYAYTPGSNAPGILTYEASHQAGARLGLLLSAHVGVALGSQRRWLLESEGSIQGTRSSGQLGLLLKTAYRL